VSATLERYDLKHSDLEFRPISGRIGAEVHGVRLTGSLAQHTIDAIDGGLLRYRALFFPNQQHLSEAEQERFASRFGELVSHPTVPSLEGTEHILDVDGAKGGRASSWHTDITFISDYPKVSFLRAMVAPDVGGDTVFANTVAAYEDLAPPLRDLAEKLWTLHTNEYDYAGTRVDPNPVALRRYEDEFISTVYETEHPLVRVHPVTGERSLILGHFVKKVLGVPRADSQLLLNLFEQHILRPENQIRWRWKAGDLAMWDNRATQHRAIDDYGDRSRIMRRSTVRGEVPVSVDGRTSVTRITGRRGG